MDWDRIPGAPSPLSAQDALPARTFRQQQRMFAQFLGQCGVDIDQVVNARGGLQDMLLALHRARKRIEAFRRTRTSPAERTGVAV